MKKIHSRDIETVKRKNKMKSSLIMLKQSKNYCPRQVLNNGYCYLTWRSYYAHYLH